jgi:hypothetical protein
MSATATPSQPNADELLVKLAKRTKRLSVFVIVVVILFAVAAGVGFFLLNRKLNALQKSQKDTEFSLFITDTNALEDFVQPTVNTIQFLRHGYSILFDKVEYTQNGLVLSGQIGNPTHLWISSLALTLSARPLRYKLRDKWDKDPYGLWSGDWNIGTAQTTVGALNPGSTTFFEVTIPNVKQTSDNMEIAVSFSGERYQYLGR